MTDNRIIGKAFMRSLGTDISIAMGYESKIQQITKFGENSVVGTSEEDIWSLGGTETFMTTAAALFLSTTEAADTSQVFQIEGLDGSWNQQLGFVTANGRNQVEIKDVDGGTQTWHRVFRVHQISAEPAPAGDVYIAETDDLTLGVPDTTTKIHGFIDISQGANITEKCMYTVPVGMACLITGIRASIRSSGAGSARSCDLFLEIQHLADGATVANPSWEPFLHMVEESLSTTAQVHHQLDLKPLLLTELANFKMVGEATASCDVTASIEFFLFPKEWVG